MSKIICYNCNKPGHYASKCPEPKNERNPLLKAYMSGLEYAHDEGSAAHDDESDLDHFIQDAAEEFATRLYALVSQTLPSTDETGESDHDFGTAHNHDHTESDVPGEQPEESATGPGNTDPSPEDASEAADLDYEGEDGDSQYTYSPAPLSAHTASLHNLRAAVEAPPSKSAEPDPSRRVDCKSMWDLEDMMDVQTDGWSDEFHHVSSMWCDMVLPRLQGVYARLGFGQLNCDISEVQTLLMLAVFLHIGTHRDMKECLRHLVRSAINVWCEGRRAVRSLWASVQKAADEWTFTPTVSSTVDAEAIRIMNICMDHSLMYLVFDKWDISKWTHPVFPKRTPDAKTEVSPDQHAVAAGNDTSSIESGESNHETTYTYSIVGHIEEDVLKTISVWVSLEKLVIPEDSHLLLLGMEDTWQNALARMDDGLPLVTSHPDRASLLATMEKYSVLGPDVIPPAWSSCTTEVCSGDVELWERHLANYSDSVANAETDVDSGEDGESTVNSSAVRMFAYVTNERGHRTTDSHLARVITTTENCGSFASLKVSGLLQSWYHDPGSLLTQMTSEEIAKCDPPLQKVSQEQVHFVCAEHALSKTVNLYRASGVCLINPRTGAVSKQVTTYILENPDLRVYPRILGKNTLSDLGVSTHHRSGTMSDDSGKTWALWAFTDELSTERDVGEFRDYIDKRCLKDVIEDYLHGVLVEPPVDLSDARLYDIRYDALRGSWAEKFPADPDYAWSDQQFLTAVKNSDEGYFMLAVIKDMALLQRLLKRSPANFASFVVFVSKWFQDCPKLLQLWREVWSAGSLGRPMGTPIKRSVRRERRLARLGFSPPGVHTSDPDDRADLLEAQTQVANWSDEDRSMHVRIATCQTTPGHEPDPESDDLSIHSVTPEGEAPKVSDLEGGSSDDHGDSSQDLLEATKAVFDTPIKANPMIGAVSLGLANPRERIIGSDFPECKDSTTGPDSVSPFTSPDESIKRLFANSDSSEETMTPPDPAKGATSGITDESTGEDSPVFKIKSRKRSRRTRSRLSHPTKTSRTSDYSQMVQAMPKGVLDQEALHLLRPAGHTSKGNRKATVDKGKKGKVFLTTRSSGLRITGDSVKSEDPPKALGPTVRAMVEEAANQGAYVPVRMGESLSVWHYDSGAGISQFTPKALKQLAPYITKVDWDDVKFVTAKDISRTTMTLYKVDDCSLMQMESQIRSTSAPTYLLCNPHLQTFDRLFGVNSMKDLKLCDRHVNDVVEDDLGRPFRKYSRNQLTRLNQSVQAWNRKKARQAQRALLRAPVRVTATSTVGSSHRSRRAPTTVRVAQPTSATPREESWRKRFMLAETNDDRGVFANLIKFKIQEIQDMLLRSPLKLSSTFPNFESFLRAKWREDQSFEHKWKTLWARRRRGLEKPSVRKRTYQVPPVPGPPLPPLPPLNVPKSDRPPLIPFKKSDLWSIPDSQGRISALAVCRDQERARRKRASSPPKVKPDPAPIGRMTTGATDPLGWMRGKDTGLVPDRKEGEGESDVHEGQAEPPTSGPEDKVRPQPKPPWQVDPTPPWLKQPISFKVQSFTEAPLEINPDLYVELRHKARQRWTRPFSAHVMGGHSRLLYQEKELKSTPIWKRSAVMPGQAILAVPGPQTVRKLCQSLLKAQHARPTTSALLLIPEDMVNQKGVKEFLHAYCLQGETFRGGPLFRRQGAEHWLHLNQAVHEFWFDAMRPALPHLNDEQQKELDDFVSEFSDCIGDSNTSNARRQSASSGTIPYVRLPVKADYERSSDVPFKKNPKTRQLTIDFVRDMERRGLVSRCTEEELEFVCNSLMLPKGGDKYRFVCTFTGLNANMIRDPYGMRTLDAVLTALEGRSWFSVLDVVDGFFNLPLYPADRGFTAFHTPIGTYKWNVLPQGTSASPQIFQRTMDRWFSAFLWKSVIVWVDDLLVYSKDFKTHMKHLRQVFSVARKYGLVFNKSKLKLCQREVKYIGYVFGVNGITTDPDKIGAVHDMPKPVSRKQVKSFLGFAGFYRRFMPPSYASTISPLTNLTRPSVPFKWDITCQRAFDRVKLLLTTTPVLVHPDFSLPFAPHPL